MNVKRYLTGNKLGNLWNDAFRQAFHEYMGNGCTEDRAIELAEYDAQQAVDRYCDSIEHGLGENGKSI